MGTMKADGAATTLFGEKNYEVPKSVFAMLSYYLARRILGEVSHDEVLALLHEEWCALNANGIVQQKPKRFETEAEELARLEAIAQQKKWLPQAERDSALQCRRDNWRALGRGGG